VRSHLSQIRAAAERAKIPTGHCFKLPKTLTLRHAVIVLQRTINQAETGTTPSVPLPDHTTDIWSKYNKI
jgi:hypothetical protein